MCSPLSLCLFIQSVYAYTYPPTTPINVREECAPDKISLLYAVDCLFYRYDKQQWIKYIWAIGLLAAGQSSTMTVSCGVYDVITVRFECVYLFFFRVHTLGSLSWRYVLYHVCIAPLLFLVGSNL